jgi:hypothetical protein
MSDKRGIWTALLAMVGLGGIGVALASRPTSASVITPPSPRPLDWSGCGQPPAYIHEAPKFSCQGWVHAYRNNAAIRAGDRGAPNDELVAGPYKVVGRNWGPIPDGWDVQQNPYYHSGKGEWTYDLIDTNGRVATNAIVPEYWLQPATAPTTTIPPPAPITQRQEAAMNLPLYPQGLKLAKGPATGEVLSISKAADGYHYIVKAGMWPSFEKYQGTETEVRDMLAQKLGQQSYGFFFPEGVTLTAGRAKIQIQKRTLKDGKRGYLTDQGPIEEPKLILKLYEGLKA